MVAGTLASNRRLKVKKRQTNELPIKPDKNERATASNKDSTEVSPLRLEAERESREREAAVHVSTQDGSSVPDTTEDNN